MALKFEGLDIRGKAYDDADTASFELAGKAYGTYALQNGQEEVYVGRDNRTSSPDLEAAFSKGLASTGCTVVRLGLVPTPLVYFAAESNSGAYAAIITASHLSMASNGLKFCRGHLPVLPKEVGSMLEKPFLEGKGAVRDPGDIIGEYIDFVSKKESRIDRHVKVVADCQNGATSVVLPRLLERLGLRAEFLHTDISAGFPFDEPNPEKSENLRLLSEKVLESHADIGIAFDGDGDRLGVIDNTGRHISTDRIVALFARDILQSHPGGKVVFDVLCSMALRNTILAGGGTPVEWKSGHAYIKEKLHEQGALLGGENSGHVFFADRYPGYDDGIYAAVRLLDLLSRSGEKLSALDTSLPQTFISEEERPACPNELKPVIVQEMRIAFEKEGYDLVTIDGVKVYFEHGWGLIRAASTSANLSLRFEADTPEARDEYHDIFWERLKVIGEKHGVNF